MSGEGIAGRLPFPLWAMAFRATSLGDDGFPFEVGLACWPRAGGDVTWFSSLIRPEGPESTWNLQAIEAAGIPSADILAAPSATAVTDMINLHLGQDVVHTASGSYCSFWCTTLYRTARRWPTFTMASWDDVLAHADDDVRKEARLRQRGSPLEAGPAAAHMLICLAGAMGHEPGLRETTHATIPTFLT